MRKVTDIFQFKPSTDQDERARLYLTPVAIKLVRGQVENPDPENIIDLGFVDIQDKYDAYAAAEFFCNPSQMESFSIVIMESWLAGRPVLVNGKCPVTKDFAIQANGGLYYDNYAEFEECARYLMTHEKTAAGMGQNGRQYVLEHFRWDVITKNYRDYFHRLAGN